MAAFTNYAEEQIIARMFRGDTSAFPATWYVGLLTAAPGEASAGTEVSGGSYARVAVANASAAWAAVSGGNGTTSNVAAVTFPTPTAGWLTATHFGIYDAATAGNLWVYGALGTSKTINTGDAPSFQAGTLTVQVDN